MTLGALWPMELLAQVDWDIRWWPFGATFRPAELAGCLGVLTATLFIAWGLWRWSRWQSSGGHGPAELFHRLCAAHGLHRSQRRLLRRLAASQGLDEPAHLFIEPDRLHAARVAPELRRYEAALAELRLKLYGGPAEALPGRR